MATVSDAPSSASTADDAFFVDLGRRRRERWEVEERAVDGLAELWAHLAAATARFVELVWQHTNRHGGNDFLPFDLELTTSAITSIVDRSTGTIRTPAREDHRASHCRHP